MIKIFSHENLIVAHNIKNLLEIEGIPCRLKNDMINSSSGEVPPIEVWPELWIEKEADVKRAKEIIQTAIHGDPSKTSWLCQHCGEYNEPSFEICWQCGKDAHQ